MARIRTRTMTQMFRRVGQSLRAGVDARRIWGQEAERGSPGHRRQIGEINRRIQGGDTVAEAVESTNGYFPPLAKALIDVGEQSGKLDAVLLRLADHYDHVLAMRRTFLVSIAWPAIQAGAAVLIIGFLIWILGVLEAPVKILGLAGASGAAIFFLAVGAIVGLFALLVMSITRGWVATARITPLLTRVPGLGVFMVTSALSRFSWSLSMALDAGIDVRRSMRLALRSTQNLRYTSHVEEIDAKILRGDEMHEALRATHAFPDDFLDALEAAELSGTQSESLSRLADDYQERAIAASRVLTIVAGFVTYGLVMVVLAAVVISLFKSLYFDPLYDALEQTSPGGF